MRVRSLRILIVGSLLAIHVVVTGIFLIAAWESVRDDQREFATSIVRSTVRNVSDHTRDFLDRLSRVTILTRGLAEAEIVRTERMDQLERYFFEVLRANPEITGVYYGSVDGGFVFVTREAPGIGRGSRFFSRTMTADRSGRRSVVRLRRGDFDLVSERDLGWTDPFDPRERPWFRDAIHGDGVTWTRPYVFYTAKILGISSGAKVVDAGGGPIGVVGADVSLSVLQNFSRKLTVGKSGYAFLLDADGHAISHPALTPEGSAPPPDIAALGDPVLAGLAGRLTDRNAPPTGPVTVTGPDRERYLVMAEDLRTNQGDWVVGAVVPESDLFGWFAKLTRTTVLLAVGSAVLWCLGGLLLWRYIDRRFEGLRTLAGRIAGSMSPAAAEPAGSFVELATTEAAIEGALHELDRQRRDNLELLRQARESDRAKTLFLAGMSHELRTPLNAIGGFAEVIEHEMFGPIGEARYREYAALIGQANGRMLDLVQNLLDSSALEFGGMELHPETVALDPLTVEIAREQRADTSAGPTLEISADTGLVVRVDATKLRILLANLVRNALAHTPPEGRVTVTLRRTAEGAPEFVVQDTGDGMDPAQLTRLRQPFGRSEGNAYVTSGSNAGAAFGSHGAGLGLSIVDRIADLMGATVRFDTAPGAGTRVMVTLTAGRVVNDTAEPE